MFEEVHETSNRINPESINPHNLQRPEQKKKEEEKKHVEYEDTPEYRKSLNMKVLCHSVPPKSFAVVETYFFKGSEREAILNQLRRRLGLSERGKNEKAPPPNPSNNKKVSWHEGKVETVEAKTTKATTTTTTTTTTAKPAVN